MGIQDFLKHGFSQSEGSKLFDKHQQGVRSLQKAGAAYKDAVSQGDTEKAATIYADIKALDQWLTQSKSKLDTAEYDLSDKLYAGAYATGQGLTGGLAKQADKLFADDTEDAALEEIDKQADRVLGKGYTGGLLGDNIPEEVGTFLGIGKVVKGLGALKTAYQTARSAPVAAKALADQRKLLKKHVNDNTSDPAQRKRFYDKIDSGALDELTPKQSLKELYAQVPTSTIGKIGNVAGSAAKKLGAGLLIGGGATAANTGINALTGSTTSGNISSLLTGDRGESTRRNQGGPIRGNRAGVSAEQIAAGHSNLPTPRQILEFVPVIGDILGAEEIYRELQAPNPNWPLIGALGGATVIGLVPGAGDAVASAIKAGARAGLKGVKGGIELAKRIEVDPNALGSTGGNIRLKPKDTELDIEVARQAIPNMSERAEALRQMGLDSPFSDEARKLGVIRPEMVEKAKEGNWDFNPNLTVKNPGIGHNRPPEGLRDFDYDYNNQFKNTEAADRSANKPILSDEELYDKDYLDAAARGPHSGSFDFGKPDWLIPGAVDDVLKEAPSGFQRALPLGDGWEDLTNLRTANEAIDQASLDKLPSKAKGNWSEFMKVIKDKPAEERERLMIAWRDKDKFFEGINPNRKEVTKGYGWNKQSEAFDTWQDPGKGIISGHRSVESSPGDLGGLLSETEQFKSGLIDDPRGNPFSKSYVDPPQHLPNIEAIVKDVGIPKRIQNAEELHKAYDKVLSKNPNVTPEQFAEVIEENKTAFGRGEFSTIATQPGSRDATFKFKNDSAQTEANKAKKMIAQFIKLRNTPGAREAYVAKEAKKKARRPGGLLDF